MILGRSRRNTTPATPRPPRRSPETPSPDAKARGWRTIDRIVPPSPAGTNSSPTDRVSDSYIAGMIILHFVSRAAEARGRGPETDGHRHGSPARRSECGTARLRHSRSPYDSTANDSSRCHRVEFRPCVPCKQITPFIDSAASLAPVPAGCLHARRSFNFGGFGGCRLGELPRPADDHPAALRRRRRGYDACSCPVPSKPPRFGGVLLALAGLGLALIIFRATAGQVSSDTGPYFWIFSAIALVRRRPRRHPSPAGLFGPLFRSDGFRHGGVVYAAVCRVHGRGAGADLCRGDPDHLCVRDHAGGLGPESERSLAMAGLAEYDTVSREPFMAACVGFALMGVLLFVIFDKADATSAAASAAADRRH